MKKFSLIVFLVIIWSAYGMTWDYYDFEDGTLTGTTMLDVDLDGNNWEILPTVKGGSYVVKSESGALTPDNWLISSRMMEVERYSNTVYPHIKFMVGGNDPTLFAEKYQILVSYGNTAPASFFVVHEETLTSAAWKEVDIDLMPFFTEFQWYADMFVAIRHFDSTGQSALLFDEMMVYTEPAFNFGSEHSVIVEGPIKPYTDFDLRWDIYDRTAYDVDWELTNGYDSVQFHYIITDESGSQPEVAIDIFPTTDLSCLWCYDVTVPGRPIGTFIEYWLVVVDGSGYGVFGESQHFNVEWGEINFDEGFEYGALPPVGWLPAGWSTFQLGDNQGNVWDQPWEVDVAQQNFHGGEYSITAASQNNFGEEWFTEDYLVSPRMRINGVPSLKYFVNAQTPEGFVEKWSLLISTVDGPGTDIENFTLIYTDSIVAGASDDEWIEKVMLLDDYTDEYIRVMWKKHYIPVAVKLDRYLNIDDISISQPPTIEVGDVGNAALPDDPFEITLTATDYSGI
ncbi:MAG: choice-of-anchor J domain-containing protein, partial [Candidatus Delongbacteria bacterium]|nr:choice-of-anchor J domain-containing protein [Candidatus Delongbacteria bacterium]